MRISFGLAVGEGRRPGTSSVARLPTSQFFDREATERQTVKRAKVTEMSHGRLQVSKDGSVATISQVHLNDEGQCVIPCTNRLDDLSKEASKVTEKVEMKLPEIKYGLNLLPAGEKRAIHLPQKCGTPAVSMEADIPGSSRVLDSENDPDKFPTKDTSTMGDSKAMNDIAASYADAASNGVVDNGRPEPTTDADVASLILKDLEKEKLREKLFGDSLVERASDTVPILLRSKGNRRQKGIDATSDAQTVDSLTYENVPVEKFGLAMLLGMGFDPQNNTNKPKEYKRRVYERAGLGADAHMQRNMEALTNAGVMAKLKKDQMYHQTHDGQDAINAATTWLFPGLYVRIVERDHPHFGEKGVVTKADGLNATLDIHGTAVAISPKGVESVVSQDAVKCKVVRRIARHAEKFYVPIGTIVHVSSITRTYAKIRFRDQSITVSLDDICEFR